MIKAPTFRIAAALGLVLLSTACTIKPGYADVHLPAIESDNMMLQAGDHTRLFGDAAPREPITITYGDRTATTTADQDGHWQVTLKKLKAGEVFDITVKGSNTVTIKNVLVGEVWLCSGQSNMEFPLSQADNGLKIAKEAKDQQIRVFIVKHNLSTTPTTEMEGRWGICNGTNVNGFSAVGYFFGLGLSQDLKKPVGLIQSCWGGTPGQAWTSLDALAADPVTAARYHAFAKKQLAELNASMENYKKAFAEWKASQEGKSEGEKSKPPVKPSDIQYPYAPSMIFNAMIAPMREYTIGGVIWYQGESNAGHSDDALAYRRLFPVLIKDWRKQFGLPELPFLFVQLAGYEKKEGPNEVSPWAELRESQLLTLGLPHTGMAVAVDIGDEKDVHPKNKLDVGKRLERIAMAQVYGKKEVFSGPIFTHMEVKDGKAICHFKYADSGLKTAADGHVPGFVICGPDKKFVQAQAVIQDKTVVVSSPEVKQPLAVRYAWAGFPPNNLYNKDGLPASPFRSDVPAEPAVDFKSAGVDLK